MALNFTPKAVTGGHSATPVDPAVVTDEVKAEVEEAIGFFVANPEGMALTVEFPTAADKQKWVGQAQAYAPNRPADKGEPFILRVSPGKGAGTAAGTDTGKLQFRMYPKSVQDARAAERKAISDAAKAAKAAADQAAAEVAAAEAAAAEAAAAKPTGKTSK